MAECTAAALTRLGHHVIVATRTPSTAEDHYPYQVLRRPNAWQLLSATRWADAVLQHHISLNLIGPALLLRKPTVVVHHMWTPRIGPGATLGRLKHRVSRLVRNVSVSDAIAGSLSSPSTVIPNLYRADVFFEDAAIERSTDLMFLGRLLEGKGAGVLIDALIRLHQRGLTPSVTIVGDGPDAERLKGLAQRSAVAAQVRFTGSLTGNAVADELRRHRILVVPSLWEEPFGLVVLEGMACGAVPVVSDRGGLPSAVGECGPIVPAGDAEALETTLQSLLTDPQKLNAFRNRASAHLAAHHPEAIARRYVEELRAALAGSTR